MSTRPLLTIAVPTWNRCRYLVGLIRSVVREATDPALAGEVEVVVSDNASEDETPAAMAELAAHSPVPIRYVRNATNLGASRNFLRTLEEAAGTYWMLFGDDDELAPGALAPILAALRAHGEAPAFLFRSDIDRRVSPGFRAEGTGYALVEATRNFFYHLGNAGYVAVRTDSARAGLARVGPGFMTTCWQITEIAYLAMAEEGRSPALWVESFDSARSPYHHENTLYTSYYLWATVVEGLYLTAYELRSLIGREAFEAARALSGHPERLRVIFREFARYALLFDEPGDRASSRKAIGSFLWAHPREWPRVWPFWLTIQIPYPLATMAIASWRLGLRLIGQGERAERMAQRIREGRERRRMVKEGEAKRLVAWQPGEWERPSDPGNGPLAC
jgi:glycosyltransferase involved in cell wall biosynthesis